MVVLYFAIAIMLMVSKQTYTGRISSNVITYLGEISAVIYIVHWTCGAFVKVFLTSLPIKQQIIIYYVSIIIVSLILKEIVARIIKKIKIKRLFLK